MMSARNFSVMFIVVLASAALFYFGREHWGHIFGVLPYLLFLACPLMHLFMHRHHRAHDGQAMPDTRATPRNARRRFS